MLTAGPETDLAVAKACGVEIHGVDDFGRPQVVKPGPWEHQAFENPQGGPPIQFVAVFPFLPSTDINDAFLSAEKSPFWKEYRLIKRPNGSFEFEAFCLGDDGWSRFGECPTIPLAICAAFDCMTPKPFVLKRRPGVTPEDAVATAILKLAESKGAQ